MRDQELILRFLALFFNGENYQRPMEEFPNSFMGGNRRINRYNTEIIKQAFLPTVELIALDIGTKAFKPVGPFNAAVFDSVMIGVATMLAENRNHPDGNLRERYDALLRESEYVEATLRATADLKSVQTRIDRAVHAFKS